MKFEKIQPGMKLYDVGTQKMGNTSVKTIAVWPVNVISVDPERRTVVASWNCNSPRTFTERVYSKWKSKPPILVQGPFGNKRRPTREELARIKAEKAQNEGDKS